MWQVNCYHFLLLVFFLLFRNFWMSLPPPSPTFKNDATCLLFLVCFFLIVFFFVLFWQILWKEIAVTVVLFNECFTSNINPLICGQMHIKPQGCLFCVSSSISRHSCIVTNCYHISYIGTLLCTSCSTPFIVSSLNNLIFILISFHRY